MVLTPSTMLEIGTEAPDFTLSDPHGKSFHLAEQQIDKGLLVIFMCNHCPYVKHIREKLVEKIRDYQKRGITVVAINSNDYAAHPDDNPERMAEDIETFGYSFPYLIDEDQKVAHSYKAACTPDLFLFGSDRKLVYRGQFDGARPGNTTPVTGKDLSMAVDQLLTGRAIDGAQQPSMGCNIKWKPGNEPIYFTA
ncbi:MAG: thioredoxin family protein [Desulfofustis sp.]|jgi:peroxiredoxin